MNLKAPAQYEQGLFSLYFLLLTRAFIYAMLNISAIINGDFVYGHISKAVCH